LFLLEIERIWNWRALRIERENKRQLRCHERSVKGYPNAIAKARIYESALAQPNATYSTVARSFNVSREEVCQYMTVLRRLPDDVRAAVEDEHDPARVMRFSLRQLLRIARLFSNHAKRIEFSLLRASLAARSSVTPERDIVS
jgi:hypothetical protein